MSISLWTLFWISTGQSDHAVSWMVPDALIDMLMATQAIPFRDLYLLISLHVTHPSLTIPMIPAILWKAHRKRAGA